LKTSLAILLCWAVSFVFNGIEAGLLLINPVRLRHQVKQAKPAALKLQRLLERPVRLFATVLLITNLTNVFALLLLTRRLASRFGSIGFVFALLIAWPVYVFVLSLLPKSIFRRFPLRALARLAGVLEVASNLLWPVLELGGAIGRLFLPKNAQPARLFAGREELKQLTTESEREGSLTATERALIHNVVDFRNVHAGDVMIPLAKVISVQPTSSVKDVLELSATTGVDRLPVITAEHEPVGLVSALDILFDKNGDNSLAKYMRRIVVAQENEPAYFVIQRLRAARLGLAAIVDGKKNLIGITTSEELVRRLVRSS
jgi:putative hemolysin